MTLHVGLPVKILADTPVIVVVPTSVLAVQKTIPVHTLLQPNVGRPAVTVKTVPQEAVLTQVLMPALPNAELVIIVPITAGPDKSLCPALQIITKYAYLLRNAEQDVILASIIPIVP